MADKNSEQVTYSAAQLSEALPELREAHPHAGKVQNTDKRQLMSYLASVHDGDITETDIYRDIVRNEATESLTDAINEGNVSEMQFAVGMVDHSEGHADRNAQAWLRNQILDEAYVGWVTGGMGSGKTDFAFDRADDFHHATRGRVGTNVESAVTSNDHIEGVYGYEELDAFFKESSTDTIMVLDETDQRLSGKGKDGQYADALADSLKLIRKGDSSQCYRAILLIGQTIRGAGKELRRLIKSNGHLYHKTSKTTVEVYKNVVSGELENKSPDREITGVRGTRYDFDTGEESGFDMSAALGENSDEDEDSELSRQQAIAIVLRAHKPWTDESGVSQADAADSVGYSAGWVCDRVREWRNGEYRELVNHPTPESD